MNVCRIVLITLTILVSAAGELTNTGPFTNVLRSHYWFDKDVEYDTSAAWIFGFAGGRQFTMGKGARYYSWPVHDGDVGVPISTSPASTE